MTPGGHHVPPDRRWSAPRPSRALIYLDAILYLSGGIIGPEPPWVFHRPGHAQHGAGVVFLRSRSCASNASDSGRLGFHRAEEGRSVPSAATIWPGARSGPSTSSWPWVLELRRLRDLRFPDQSSDRAYFEVGTTLTANHAHAALFGVFGMLALTVLVFCLRAMQSDATWKETQKFVRVGFWGANVGLALMIVLDLFPRRSNPALGFHRQRVLARAPPDVPDGRHLPQDGMAAHGGGCGLPLCRRPAHHARRVAECVEKGSLSHGVETVTQRPPWVDRKSTRLNSGHLGISYAVFC